MKPKLSPIDLDELVALATRVGVGVRALPVATLIVYFLQLMAAFRLVIVNMCKSEPEDSNGPL